MNKRLSPVRRSDIGWIILGFVVAALAWFFYQKAYQVLPPELKQATLLPDSKQPPDFSLVDHTGRPFDRASLSGGWNLLFFGYSHCPDVCPTTLQTLAAVDKKLRDKSPQATPPRAVFVSVDPERDTPEHLATYVPYFNPAFLGVTGAPDQIQRLATGFGILYARAGDDGAGNYLVDHSASVLLFDPDGSLRAVFSPPHDADAMAQDIPAIQHYYEVTH
jgi:protein SCO1/2